MGSRLGDACFTAVGTFGAAVSFYGYSLQEFPLNIITLGAGLFCAGDAGYNIVKIIKPDSRPLTAIRHGTKQVIAGIRKIIGQEHYSEQILNNRYMP